MKTRERWRKPASELARRYGSDYRLEFETSAKRARARVKAFGEQGCELALNLSVQLPGHAFEYDLLELVREHHPRAKRALLIEFGAWADPQVASGIRMAMAAGQIDYYVLKPWRSPDELFHRTLAEFIHEWSRTAPTSRREIALVAPRWSPRGHAIRTWRRTGIRPRRRRRPGRTVGGGLFLL